MTLDAEKTIRLFELCEEILAVKNEIPKLDGEMTGATDRTVRLQMAEQLRDSLLANHSAALKELAIILQ
jgi:ribosomal 50S subunit-associated protein YjgA (DUF615 family)